MFSLHEFIILPFEEQCDFIALGAIYLAKREERTQKVYLYHMFNFFIEVRYCTELDEIVKIEGFKNTENLVPYFRQIDITSLIVN